MAVILGISGSIGWDGNIPHRVFETDMWTHGSGATLFCDGTHIGSISEERLTREKADGSYPKNAIAYVLDMKFLTNDDVTDLVYVDATRMGRELLGSGYIQEVLSKNFPNANIHHCHHQIAHASATYYASPFEESAVLTMDGGGSVFEINQVESCDNGSFSLASRSTGLANMTRHYHNYYRFGAFYSASARMIYASLTGKNVSQNLKERETYPGKVMGLQAYGDSTKVDLPPVLYSLDDGFYPRIETNWKVMEELYAHHDPMDLASWVQDHFEETIVRFLDKIKFNQKNLCLAGGCALNILTNTRLLKEKVFDEIFVFPAASDDGLNFGGAIKLAFEIEEELILPENLGTLGREYSEEEIEEALKDIDYVKLSNAEVYDLISDKLVENKIIGWHQGRSEFGPRALGNRSILANPTIENQKDHISQNIKFREWWRPYAPIILEEDLQDWLDFDRPSPYMLFAADVHEGKRSLIPAVTHVDGSTRVQTVNQFQNKKAYKLIKKFKEKTGVPLLLNTSFNTSDEPIVESPQDAINTFGRSKIDILVLGNYVVQK